ncbi:GDP/GTP exchange factor [Scheffersomyces stipitis CBS 6054]|uniref:GDP/GTP exchange factor n=1 Tax=Scheffersomyces stipitis (strain ATCC 58785 / CBS 6054 / NBRC 10063 / NRRL Y-11545) TaxID=322104 RepID=A3LVY6_PICST|nr:GDP/GTP exchange factor [Scheffersomyces stipitis CBS 6054]ABN67200.2 GDP/GTP exchange factor [Scheffersomyces stipitis CBS 6054]
MFFEKKIFTDLKIHWLNLINEFWQIGVEIDSLVENGTIFTYNLPLAADIPNIKKLSKSNTETSIHTNPSYRRSAMLSLYDSNAHHKMLIFDGSHNANNEENPQFSINNLLLSHQSSRMSINTKIRELQEHHQQQHKRARKNLKQSGRHNHMNIKDSSLALKKYSKNENNPEAEPEDPEQDVTIGNTTVFQPNITSNNFQSPPQNTGFSTNGNIKLPFSKVGSVLPPTPVKKMDCVLKSDQEAPATPILAPPKRPSFQRPPTFRDGPVELGRRNSIKRLVDGWRKTLGHPRSIRNSATTCYTNTENKNEELHRLINNAISVASDDEEEEEEAGRVDILTARIIDELEYLIRYYVGNDVGNDVGHDTILEDDAQQSDFQLKGTDDEFVDVEPNMEEGNDECDTKSIDIMGSPAKKPRISIASPNAAMVGEIDGVLDDEDASDMDINDLSELNIVKIDNLINTEDDMENNQNDDKKPNTLNLLEASASQESSFQRPTSINWNDEGNLDLENSNVNEASGDIDDDEEEEEDEQGAVLVESTGVLLNGAQYNVGEDIHSFSPFNHANNSNDTSISTPSNITQYDAEIADLGIALSPQSMKQTTQYPQIKRISFSENTSFQARRTSTMSRSSGSILRRDSVKSYLSYDSAFSVSNGSHGSDQIFDHDTGLRKKTGYNDLRVLAGSNGDSLTAEDRKSLELAANVKTTSMNSYVSRSSSTRKSIRFSTLYALTELPFNASDEKVYQSSRKASLVQRSTMSEEMEDSSIFSVTMKSNKNSVRTNGGEGRSSNAGSDHSVAIPGISNNVLKELAAIPDESYQSRDPVEFALNKLEGRRSESTSIKNRNSAKSEEPTNAEEIHELKQSNNTEEILHAINNANTEDAIEFTDYDMTQEPPLTPIKKKSNPAKNPITSTPNNDSIIYLNQSAMNTRSSSPVFQTPKIILDNYSLHNVYLSVENVMDNETHISFVLSNDSTSLANHFTMIEKDMLQEVDWKELIELKWNKELNPVNSWLEIIVNDKYYNANKGVNLVIARFNLMVNWIISEIILTKNQKERISIISRFIHIAQKCYTLQNFSTLMQVILALTSEKVQQLRYTWKNLAPGDILMLKNLEELSSPLKNFLNIRLCINHMKPSKGCIPFVGLYLSDLVFNAERPTFIKRAPSFPDLDDTASTINSRNESEKLVNFSKFRTSVHIVKSLSQCIEWSSNYEMEIDPDLLSRCLYIKSLDEEEMNYCLENIDDY